MKFTLGPFQYNIGRQKGFLESHSGNNVVLNYELIRLSEFHAYNHDTMQVVIIITNISTNVIKLLTNNSD